MEYPENIEEIEKFAKEIGIDVKYLLGEKREGNLNLSSVRSLPDNIVFNVGGNLYVYYVKSLPNNIVFDVSGSLALSSVRSLPDNIVFNVDGYLRLCCVKSLPSNTIFNVNGEIYFPIDHKVKVIWK